LGGLDFYERMEKAFKKTDLERVKEWLAESKE